jgi:hypothetical protein
MSRKSSSKQSLGSLHGDLRRIAEQVQRSAQFGTLTVWADDSGEVFVAAPEVTVDVPAHWIAGTFGTGMPLQYIEDDLRALLRERARNWIVD